MEGKRSSPDADTVVVRALRGVDFSAEEGEFISVMGPSGSGKSTLMNILGCLDKPSAGTYFLDGIETSASDSNTFAYIRTTGNPDTGMTLEIMGLFQELNNRGKTIIMVTHEPELAAYTKQIITLRDGKLVSDRPVAERRSALDDVAKWNKDHAQLTQAAL
jgi:ABC-type lipoprotein export system ATPase subunit